MRFFFRCLAIATRFLLFMSARIVCGMENRHPDIQSATVKQPLYSLLALSVASVAVWPVMAAAAPTPSPSLQSILAPVPAAYSTPVKGPYAGQITAAQYAQAWGKDSANAQSELATDGFVDGYGLLLADTASGRVMAEYVIAFTGQSGALRFMGANNQRDVNNVAFQHDDTNTGLGPYYFGVHMAQASPALVLDSYDFVKGNDMFGVDFFSSRDDVLALATTQAQKQFDAAPASSIPPDDWPENQRPAGAASGFEMNQTVVIAIVALGVLLAGGIFMAMRRREAGGARPMQPQMSADGNFWWGGSNWISVTEVAPPWAQRSPDGAFWWDGRGWRPVPGALPVAPL